MSTLFTPSFTSNTSRFSPRTLPLQSKIRIRAVLRHFSSPDSLSLSISWFMVIRCLLSCRKVLLNYTTLWLLC